MSELRQIESLSEFTMLHKSPPETLFVVGGKLLNEVRVEMDKGRQARAILQMIVRAGTQEVGP